MDSIYNKISFTYRSESYIKIELEQLAYLDTPELQVQVAGQLLRKLAGVTCSPTDKENELDLFIKDELHRFWQTYLDVKNPQIGVEILVNDIHFEKGKSFDIVKYALGKAFYNLLALRFSECSLNISLDRWDNQFFYEPDVIRKRLSHFKYNYQKKVVSNEVKSIRYFIGHDVGRGEIDMVMWQIHSGRFIIDLPEEKVSRLNGMAVFGLIVACFFCNLHKKSRWTN